VTKPESWDQVSCDSPRLWLLCHQPSPNVDRPG